MMYKYTQKGFDKEIRFTERSLHSLKEILSNHFDENKEYKLNTSELDELLYRIRSFKDFIENHRK